MTDRINLNNDEQPLYDDLCVLVEQTKRFYTNGSNEYNEQRKRYAEMASKAHDLHQRLKKRGLNPRCYRYMYKNRRVPVYAIEFNDPLHPIEDLIAFINNPDKGKR